MLPVLHETSNLFRPYIDMYLFQVLDTYVMGRESSKEFLAVGALLFVISMFFGAENRTGVRLHARLLFLAIVAFLIWRESVRDKSRPASTA